MLAGLVVAHWFAFTLASIATASKNTWREDALHSLSGIGGAVFVGLFVTLTCWLVPTETETLAVTNVLTSYIALAALTIARSRKAGFWRTLLILGVVLTLAAAIILLKIVIG